MANSIPPKLLIKKIQIWNASGVLKDHDILVINGIVTEILASKDSKALQLPPDVVVYEPQDAILHPLGLDPQAHLRVPGQPEKETAKTGLKAALKGGYGAVLTMPNTNPVIDSVAVCNAAMEEIQPWSTSYGVDVYLTAAMTLGQKGETPVDANALAQWGVKALTDDGNGVASDTVMEKLFALSESSGLPLLQHAEVPGHGGVLAPGPIQEKLKVKPYFADPEVEMVKRDLALLKKYPRARYHVLHISSKETMELVGQAKNEGLNVTCEVCPHHLLFTVEDIDQNDSSFKMNPPIRSLSDREALRRGLQNGTIDFLSTDHAPHEITKKTKDFTAAAFGTTGLETALRSLLYLNRKGYLSPERIVQSFSSGPCSFLGLSHGAFEIKKDLLFQAVIVENASQLFAVERRELESLSENNCFVGFEMPGKISRVYNKSGVFEF